ncbi:unnamed protein product, partial [Closterium sp. Naga37s-1]
YDMRAGFWGVMGGPSLGILPANIPQLREPMRRDCAGGRTRVLVNGRELCQRDLAPLTRRGMPGAAQRQYTLDASGQLRDAASSALVSHLGHLAPSYASSCCLLCPCWLCPMPLPALLYASPLAPSCAPLPPCSLVCPPPSLLPRSYGHLILSPRMATSYYHLV